MYIMENLTYPQKTRNPSFSSSLLDAIYRSIDESKSNLDKDQQVGPFKETNHTTLKHINLSLKQNHGGYVEKSGNKKRVNLGRAVTVDDWMEKPSSHSSQFMNSVTSTSSESSYGGALFSSSETDTTHNHKPRPRSKTEIRHMLEKNHHQQQKPKREGGGTSFARTKLRALKIYGELNQKVRHPISPGSRIASFLSSIFNSGNVKKAKMCYVGAVEDVTFEHKSKSPCFSSSTASSFSRRSCMRKPASSAKGNKNNNNGVKRSVRFYPVSVILGEDSQPSCHRYSSYENVILGVDSQPSCHRYSAYENDPSLLPLPSVRKIARSSSIKELKKNCVVAKENGVEVAARGFMKGYQNSGKGNSKFEFRGFYGNGEDEGDEDNDYDDDEDDEDDEDGDALSYSSSDLFELDHIIGAGRYQEELPVYETTNLETNKAIANGLCL